MMHSFPYLRKKIPSSVMLVWVGAIFYKQNSLFLNLYKQSKF